MEAQVLDYSEVPAIPNRDMHRDIGVVILVATPVEQGPMKSGAPLEVSCECGRAVAMRCVDLDGALRTELDRIHLSTRVLTAWGSELFRMALSNRIWTA